MKIRLIAPAIALALLVAGCAPGDSAGAEPSAPAETAASAAPTTTAPPETVSIQGVVGLPFGGYVALEIPDGDSACRSAGDYNSIKAGAQVQALDSTGAIVGTGVLDPGKVIVSSATGESVGCQWPYLVEAEAGGKFYTVRVLDWTTDAVKESTLATDMVNVLPVDLDK